MNLSWLSILLVGPFGVLIIVVFQDSLQFCRIFLSRNAEKLWGHLLFSNFAFTSVSESALVENDVSITTLLLEYTKHSWVSSNTRWKEKLVTATIGHFYIIEKHHLSDPCRVVLFRGKINVIVGYYTWM